MNKIMSAQARQELLENLQEKYQKGNWKLKNQLLTAFVAATNYERKHAIKLLNGKISRSNPLKKRGKLPRYDEGVIKVLEMLWYKCNQMCSKRLIPFLPELVASLESHGPLHLTDEV